MRGNIKDTWNRVEKESHEDYLFIRDLLKKSIIPEKEFMGALANGGFRQLTNKYKYGEQIYRNPPLKKLSVEEVALRQWRRS